MGCIFGGPSWYRFFGAGEAMARAAARGSPTPALVTAVIATILAAWGLYAFSGAGLLPGLPFLRTVLTLIAGVYLLRAAALPWMLVHMTARGRAFLVWSSAVVLVIGITYAVGVARLWMVAKAA